MTLPPPYRFLLRGLFWFAPLWLLVVVFEILLHRAGETALVRSVCSAMTERAPDGLFMRQFFDQGLYRFKHLSILRRKPEVVALGTSRVMQFQARMFGADSKRFFNAGGMVQHVRDLEQFVAGLPTNTSICAVIVGVEYWWFNEAWAKTAEREKCLAQHIRRDDALDGFAHGHVFQRFLKHFFDSDLSQPSLSTLMAPRSNPQPATRGRAFGLTAVLTMGWPPRTTGVLRTASDLPWRSASSTPSRALRIRRGCRPPAWIVFWRRCGP